MSSENMAPSHTETAKHIEIKIFFTQVLHQTFHLGAATGITLSLFASI